jgi:outer membrane protein TolC
MKSTLLTLAACAAFLAGSGVMAQNADVTVPETINLQQALDAARSSGDDFSIADKTVGVARVQRSLDVARQGFNLAVSGAYSLGEGFGSDSTSAEQSLISKAESASGLPLTSTSSGLGQIAQGGISLATPSTKLAINASHALPAGAQANQASIVGVSGSQNLWDGYPGGQASATLAKSALVFQSKELQSRQAYSSAVAKVKQSYVAMLAAQRDLGVKRQVLEKQGKMLAQIKAIYALKQASEIDLRTAEINAKSAEMDVALAEKTLSLANERLAVIIGRDPSLRFSVADVSDPELPAPSVDEAIAIGLSKRSDLAQYALSEKSSEIDAALARASAQPNVSLTGGAGVAVLWESPVLVAEALNIGAKVSLPVIDSGAAGLQARASEGQASLYSMQAEQLKKTIASDIRDDFETVQLLLQKADLAKESASLADAQFELTKTQNTYGTATMQDVLTASVTAATAEVAYETARSAYLLGVLALETAMGL